MKIILQQNKFHVSSDTVCEFENCILKDPSVKPAIYFGKTLEKITWTLSKFIPRSVFSLIHGKDNYFAVLMGVNFRKTFPYFLKAKTKSIYLFDAWEYSHEKLAHYVDKFHINNIFFSSLEAKKLFSKRVTNSRSFWIPEAIDPNQYKAFKFESKDIDILQIGRKYDWYHTQIVNPLRNSKKIYLYERKKGEIIFPTRNGFIDGLARSKISICVPSNITHPEMSGNVSTMTIRYLQSMASKCLIVGSKPHDMEKLFDYDPLIEIDKKEPSRHLLRILDEYEKYIPLIEKNYRMVTKEHSWAKRWEEMSKHLSEG